MHDTIGCYLDIDKGHIKFSKNGKLSVDCCVGEGVFMIYFTFPRPPQSSLPAFILLNKYLLSISMCQAPW